MAHAAVVSDQPGPDRATPYGWAIFALSFGLLMSDHMARQVLNAVSPLIKAEWQLSNLELASLSSIVAAAVGVLTLPLSLAADRFGRVRSLVAMATLWSLATLGGALAQSYPQMLAARFLVGVGEAAYGSVGIAVVLAVFPVSLRSTLSASFLAGSVVGQMVGVGVGGQIAASYGWRHAFDAIGLIGLALALAYWLVVREDRIGIRPAREKLVWRRLGQQLFGKRVLLCAYFSSGIQLFCTGALAVFMPLLLTRHYGMTLAQAGKTNALFLLICAIGMVACGMFSDRMARNNPAIKPRIAMTYSLITAALFAGAFILPPGKMQLALLAGAMLPVAGVAGVAGAMAANLTPSSIHSTAMAVLALANNLLGLALGPLVIGWLSDRIGLLDALLLMPLPCLLCAGSMMLARTDYAQEMAAMQALT